MRRSILIVGAFCAVALASSSALGLALRNAPSPAGVEHRTVDPADPTAPDEDARISPSEAVAPKPLSATMPAPELTPAKPEERALPPLPRDISEMTCRPYELSAGTPGSHVMICQ